MRPLYRKSKKPALPRLATGWRRAGDLATRAVTRHNVSPQVTAAAVCTVASHLSNGEFTPVSWKDGVLKLTCHSYEQLIATRRREERLIHEINEVVHQNAVSSISYVVA